MPSDGIGLHPHRIALKSPTRCDADAARAGFDTVSKYTVDKFIGYESLEEEHPIVSYGSFGILAIHPVIDTSTTRRRAFRKALI
jgi:hypothetical protein